MYQSKCTRGYRMYEYALKVFKIKWNKWNGRGVREREKQLNMSEDKYPDKTIA